MTWPRGTEASGQQVFRAAITLCILGFNTLAAQVPPQITGACTSTVPVNSKLADRRHPNIAVPLAGVLSSPFAPRLHPFLRIVLPHHGWDIAAPLGMPVFAALDGTVEFVGRNGGYGNVIKISHSNGIATVYAHLDSFRHEIHKGIHVEAGQVIGFLGSTGLSTAPHLHLETLINGRPVDPAHFFCPPVSIPSPQATTHKSLKHKRKNDKPKEAL